MSSESIIINHTSLIHISLYNRKSFNINESERIIINHTSLIHISLLKRVLILMSQREH